MGVLIDALTFVPCFILVEIFRRVRPKLTRSDLIKKSIGSNLNNRNYFENTIINKKEMSFSWQMKIFVYILSFLIVATCIFFIIVKGIEFGDDKVEKWLITFIVSIISSIFLTQPLQVVFIALFISFVFRKYNDENDIGVDPKDNGRPFNYFIPNSSEVIYFFII
jgi:hypothetical protein